VKNFGSFSHDVVVTIVVLPAYFVVFVLKRVKNGIFWQLPACGAHLTAFFHLRRPALAEKRHFFTSAALRRLKNGVF